MARSIDVQDSAHTYSGRARPGETTQRVVKALSDAPDGLMISQISQIAGYGRNTYLYAVVNRLERDGVVDRQGAKVILRRSPAK